MPLDDDWPSKIIYSAVLGVLRALRAFRARPLASYGDAHLCNSRLQIRDKRPPQTNAVVFIPVAVMAP